MKITLVPNPSLGGDNSKLHLDAEMPLGLLTLIPVIEDLGHDVSLIDFSKIVQLGDAFGPWVIDAAADMIANDAPDMVGFSTRCDGYAKTILIAQAVKDRLPNCTIVFGGPQASVCDVETLSQFPFVDLVVRNEAEITIAELLTNGSFEQVSHISGITFRDSASCVVKNPAKAVLTELDELPFAKFDLLEESGFTGQIEFEVGRGCPFGCTFCSTNTFFARRYRLKSPERIAQEINHLQGLFGKERSIGFVHDLFTVNKNKVAAICQHLLDIEAKVTWACQARIDCVDNDLLDLMAKSGCAGIFFGVESGSEEMQLTVKKRLKLARVLPIVEHCISLGMDVVASFIYAFPEETLETLSDTLDLAWKLSELGAEVQLHRYATIPGTPLAHEYRDRLVLTEHHPDFCGYESGVLQAEYDLIREMPDIFSTYYVLQNDNLDEELLARIDAFKHIIQFFPETHRLLKSLVDDYTPMKILDAIAQEKIDRLGAKFRERAISVSMQFYQYWRRFTTSNGLHKMVPVLEMEFLSYVARIEAKTRAVDLISHYGLSTIPSNFAELIDRRFA